MTILENVVLAPYTSWLIGGKADYFVLPKSIDQVNEAMKWAFARNLNITLLGGGSNVLVSDQGIRGLTMCFKDLSGIESSTEDDRLVLKVLAGTKKSELLKVFLKHKLPPALFLAGLPGDTAGGVVMNAGVAEKMRPREFCEIVDWVEVLRPDGEIVTFDHDMIHWFYRHSYGWQPGIILRVGISWPLSPDESILEKVKEANLVRLSKQPLDQPSCGSVFVNPDGHKAAQLIDQSGLKGYQVGGAQVSQKHANFIVNTGKATASDVLAVIEHVKATVKSKAGIELKTEVIKLGEWS